MTIDYSSGRHKQEHDYSFPKQARLLRRSEFLAVTRKGKRYASRYFIVHLSPNDKNRPRLGVTVSKKIGTAVVRNRLKRGIREFFRTHQHCVPCATDVVVIARKGSAGITTRVIHEELKALLLERSRAKVRHSGDHQRQ